MEIVNYLNGGRGGILSPFLAFLWETIEFYGRAFPRWNDYVRCLESWSDKIVEVVEKDYMFGYLKDGYKPDWITKLFHKVMEIFRMSFMLHVETIARSSKRQVSFHFI